MEKTSGGGGYRPSRGKLLHVHCGHPGHPSCEGKSAILLQGLTRHTEKVHGVGVKPLIKGEQKVEGFLVGAKRNLALSRFCCEFGIVAITCFHFG